MLEGFLVEYMPHGQCYAWNPLILWPSVVSDLLIASAYFSIPLALVLIIRKRTDLQFKGVFILFALFILCCGITHLVSVYTIWHGAYGLHTLTKILTALVSVATACYIFLKIDQILSVPSKESYHSALEDVANERVRRIELEQEKKSASIFNFTTQFVPTGLLVIDENSDIRLVNSAAEEMFGYSSEELIGKPLSSLLETNLSETHNSFVREFIQHEQKEKLMASGRVVKGRHKRGSIISLEIKIAVHRHEGETYALASFVDTEAQTLEKQKETENNARTQRALEATHDGIWEWNVVTNEVWYSPRLMILLGRDPNEAPKYEYWEAHIHPEDKSFVLHELHNNLKGQGKFDVIYRGNIGNDEYQWMHARGDTVAENQGKPLLMSGTLTNVNELKKLQLKLEEKSLFLKEVLDKSLTGLYIFDMATLQNTYINPEYTRICGYSLDELNAIQNSEDGLMGLFHPEEQAYIQSHFKEVIEETMPDGVGIEYRFKHKDGHWIWCYSRDSIYQRNEKGEPISMLGAFFDITDIKNRENEVRELALNFTSAFDQAAVGMALVSLDGQFLKVNTKLCQTLGYTEEELIPKRFSDITHEDDLESSRYYLKKLLNNEIKQFELENRYLTKDGSVIWGKLTVAMVVDHEGSNRHFASVIEDISIRKSMEKKLAQSNASLERFAYSASHDLQEPLRKISAFAGLVQKRLKGNIEDKDVAFQLERMSDAAKRMGEMIRSLLELSRYSSIELEKAPVPLSQLVDQVLEDLSVKISKSEAVITLNADKQIFVETNSFQQVLRNLILNAILYTKTNEKPNITVNCADDEISTIIHIENNGLEISEEQAEVMFEPFRRLHNTPSRGTGMGLAICKQIVASHGGTITCTYHEGLVNIAIVLPKGS